MQYGLDIPINGEFSDPRALAQLAAEAEAAGWDGFFVQEGVFCSREEQIPLVDPWIALTAIAMHTQRLKIGVMITPLSRRRPWQVARHGLALDQLSNGRFIFGAGLGCADLDFLSFDEEYDPKIRAEMLDGIPRRS